jgi:hypothetical protein
MRETDVEPPVYKEAPAKASSVRDHDTPRAP